MGQCPWDDIYDMGMGECTCWDDIMIWENARIKSYGLQILEGKKRRKKEIKQH